MLAPPSVRISLVGCSSAWGSVRCGRGWSCSSRSGGTSAGRSLSIRELADRHGVHRRTVRQALATAVPPPRKAYPPRPRPAIDPWVAVIDGWLLADRDAPRKQRHTARRVWQRLVAEHGAVVAGGDGVAVCRAAGGSSWGLDRVEVAVPQTHPPGAEAEVDFGEFYVRRWTACR